MSAQPSSFIPSFPPHVFIHTKEERRVKHNHQQLQHVINRMLTALEVPDKAARGITGLHGVFNGREVGKFPAFIAHKWTARQLNFKGKEENTDQFMCRVLGSPAILMTLIQSLAVLLKPKVWQPAADHGAVNRRGGRLPPVVGALRRRDARHLRRAG
jgi:hypothetical protein